MSNLGYARGIDGTLMQHLRYAHRHVYCSRTVQEQTLRQLRELVMREDPDVCCFVEIDQGSFDSANFNQLEMLLTEKYAFSDIENKYGQQSPLRRFPMTRGKSNAFIARQRLHYEKIYFTHGRKRLIYKLTLAPQLTLFFAHFSLKKTVREEQLRQVGRIVADTPGDIIFMGDFNILTGIRELKPLLDDGLVLLNREDSPTFRFHRRQSVLDLCLCSSGIARQAELTIVPQPYSDHAALLLALHPTEVRP